MRGIVLTAAVLSSVFGFACGGLLTAAVAYRVAVKSEAIDEASKVIFDLADNWGDLVTIERIGGSCRTYNVQTRQNVGPWPRSADGQCHIRDLIRARIVEQIGERRDAPNLSLR